MDLNTETQIDILIEKFYAKVSVHEILGPFFKETNWEYHVPRIRAFWYFILLDKPGFKGNIYDAHVNRQIKKVHFDIWVQIFCDVIDEHYQGEVAEKAKSKAKELALLFSWKLTEKDGA